MKRILAVLLVVLMMLSCCSCMGDTTKKDSESSKDKNKPTEVTVNEVLENEMSDKDTDGDGLYDHAEIVYKTDKNKSDTDGDGFSDYEELKKLGTDPLLIDTDGDGINDFDDDNDGDALSNSYEFSNGLDPNFADSDFDGVSDGDEVQMYRCNALNKDTDSDGATDGWEIENGFDPVAANDSFAFSVSAEKNGLTAGAKVNVNGQVAESVSVEPLLNNTLIDETVPGALGSAYEFNVTGDLGAVEIFFQPSSAVLSNDAINPVIYCLNEETQVFYEMETSVENGVVKTETSHFSTYILLDKNVYEEYLKSTYSVDYNVDSGVDSNSDGISDYLTKLMCDGIIRTGTGTMVFGDHTYEEVQASADVDEDGVINGDEVSCDYFLEIPDDAKEFNGHYYKAYDTGEFCLSARTYCESVGGYLCTITSQEEQNFVVGLFENKNVYWLGGTCIEKAWGWITEEEFSYTKWGDSEPNNMEGSENYLQIYAKDFRKKVVGDWNDASNVGAEYASDFYSIANTGYICEWGSFTVNSHKYAFINSSPIHSDTDNDGFVDAVDPTPVRADCFKDLQHYIQNKYNGVPSATFVADQPEYGSNIAITTNNDVGHSFVVLSDGNGEFVFRGFYPADWGESKYDDYIDYTISNIYSRGLESTNGQVFDDRNHKWDVAYSKAITEEQMNDICEYIDVNEKNDYNLQSNNCTTFAVNALEAGDFGITDYVSKSLWALPAGYAALTLAIFYPYGYSPGNAGYGIMKNAPGFVGHTEIQLKDGTMFNGVCDLVLETNQ